MESGLGGLSFRALGAVLVPTPAVLSYRNKYPKSSGPAPPPVISSGGLIESDKVPSSYYS